jgi:hypothetical protein
MGTAKLDINRLAGLLERKKVESTLIDDDSALDHCVLRLESVRRPAVVAFLEYENQGVEPRLVGMVFHDETFMPQKYAYPLDWEKTLELAGAIKDDPGKIARWVEREFLGGTISQEA